MMVSPGFQKVVTFKLEQRSCTNAFDHTINSNDNGVDDGGFSEENGGVI